VLVQVFDLVEQGPGCVSERQRDEPEAIAFLFGASRDFAFQVHRDQIALLLHAGPAVPAVAIGRTEPIALGFVTPFDHTLGSAVVEAVHRLRAGSAGVHGLPDLVTRALPVHVPKVELVLFGDRLSKWVRPKSAFHFAFGSGGVSWLLSPLAWLLHDVAGGDPSSGS
jgi:hypothetical protein